MTREELFRAVGEVREDQIEAAETVKKQSRSWRRLAALAACLALVVAAAAFPWRSRGQPQWSHIIYSFNPGVVKEFSEDAGNTGSGGDLDGVDYWTDSPTRPSHPDYSAGVEIGEMDGPGSNSGMMGLSSCAAWLSPEEIFAQDTEIFRGTVRELQYYQVELDAVGMRTYYTRCLVEVTDPIRGSLKAGETYSLLWLGAKGYMTTSLIGPLEDLDVGSEAIFMPIRTDRDTGWKEGDSYFCYADLAELYLGEGMRYVFAGTGEGLAFDRSVYPELAEAETLDEVAAYIREAVEKEAAQPAAVPPVPQTDPFEADNPEEADPGYFSDGPNGALEIPAE